MPPATFNSKECAQVAYKLDSAVCVSIIQASKVVEAGYLQSSSKMLDNIHWTDHYNFRPRLKKMDVQVNPKKIQDPIEEEGGKHNDRNYVFAAHILCAKKVEKEANIQMGNLYNKYRKLSRAATDLLEA